MIINDKIRARAVELKDADELTVQRELVDMMFAEDAKRLGVTETEAFRRWALAHCAAQFAAQCAAQFAQRSTLKEEI